MLPLHQRCFATPTWKKERRRIYNSSASNSDEKILLSLSSLHRTGIETFSIDGKVTIQPLHKRCSSTQISTVENILDLNTFEARFSWNILIRLGLLRHAGIKPMSMAWRCAVLPLHQWCSSIPTLEKEDIRVVYSFVTNNTAKLPSMSELLHRTGIEHTSIASRATRLPLPQRCSSIPIWTDENSRLLNSCVTGISASFCQRYRFCLVRESNPCQELEKLLCYHFINDALQLLREKRKTVGFTTHLHQIVMKKVYSA